MKFTKEQAIQELVARFKTKEEKLDLGRTISEVVENGLKMVGENAELEVTDFVSMVEPIVSSAVGFMRHETSTVAKSLQDRISELEKGQKPKEEEKPQEDDTNKELRERLEKLESELATSKAQKAISEKKEQLIAKIAELGVKDKEWVNTMLSKVSITSDTDIDTEAKDYVAMYNKFCANDRNDITPKGNPSPGGDKPNLDGLDVALRQLRGEFVTPKKD